MSDSLMEVVLSGSAKSACLSVFSDFTWDEVSKMAPSIQEAWKAGKEFDQWRSAFAAYVDNDR